MRYESDPFIPDSLRSVIVQFYHDRAWLASHAGMEVVSEFGETFAKYKETGSGPRPKLSPNAVWQVFRAHRADQVAFMERAATVRDAITSYFVSFNVLKPRRIVLAPARDQSAPVER